MHSWIGNIWGKNAYLYIYIFHFIVFLVPFWEGVHSRCFIQTSWFLFKDLTQQELPKSTFGSSQEMVQWWFHLLYGSFSADFLTHTIHRTGIFTYIYHRNQPNVGKYGIHGSYGLWFFQVPFERPMEETFLGDKKRWETGDIMTFPKWIVNQSFHGRDSKLGPGLGWYYFRKWQRYCGIFFVAVEFIRLCLCTLRFRCGRWKGKQNGKSGRPISLQASCTCRRQQWARSMIYNHASPGISRWRVINIALYHARYLNQNRPSCLNHVLITTHVKLLWVMWIKGVSSLGIGYMLAMEFPRNSKPKGSDPGVSLLSGKSRQVKYDHIHQDFVRWFPSTHWIVWNIGHLADICCFVLIFIPCQLIKNILYLASGKCPGGFCRKDTFRWRGDPWGFLLPAVTKVQRLEFVSTLKNLTDAFWTLWFYMRSGVQ